MAEGFKVADGYVDIHAEPDRESGRRAAVVVTEEAENTGRSRSRHFFTALFTPDAGVLSAMRTGIPAVLSSPIGIAAVVLGTAFASSFIATVVSAFALGGLGAAFIGLGAFALRENDKIVKEFNETKDIITKGLADVAAPLIPAFTHALNYIGDYFNSTIEPLLLQIFTGLEPMIMPIVVALGDAITVFLSAIADPAVLGPLTAFFIEIAPLIPQIAEALGQFFTILAENAGIIAAAFKIAIDIINTLIVVAANVLVFFSGMLIILKGKWDALWAALKSGGTAFITFIQNIAERGKEAWSNLVSFVSGIVENVKGKIGAARAWIATQWANLKTNLINPIRDGISSAITWISGLPGRAASALGNIGSTLVAKGKALIQGFINGIKSMIGAVGNAVSSAVGSALDWLPGSPVKKGPLMVVNQLSTNPGAKLARMIADGFNTQMQAFTPALAGFGTNVTVNPAIANPPVNVHVMLDGREIAPMVYAVADERDLQIRRAVTSGGGRLP